MGKKSIPWAVGLTGLLYFGMLGYWQYDELMMASGVSELQNQGAIFGFG